VREEAVTRWLRKLGALKAPAEAPGRPGDGPSRGASDSVRPVNMLHLLQLALPLICPNLGPE
jgi:hypothetical protein